MKRAAACKCKHYSHRNLFEPHLFFIYKKNQRYRYARICSRQFTAPRKRFAEGEDAAAAAAAAALVGFGWECHRPPQHRRAVPGASVRCIAVRGLSVDYKVAAFRQFPG